MNMSNKTFGERLKEPDTFIDQYTNKSFLYRIQTWIFNSRLEQVKKQLINEKNSFLLDIGCGPMFACQTLPKNMGYVGIDIISLNRLKDYRDNARLVCGKNNIEVMRASGYFLPFKSNIVDLAVSLDVFEHLKKPDVCADELSRVLAEKGLIIISLPLEGVLQKLLRIGFVFGKLTGSDKTLGDNRMLMVLSWIFKTPWYHYVGTFKNFKSMRKMLFKKFNFEREVFTPFKWGGLFNINSVMYFHRKKEV